MGRHSRLLVIALLAACSGEVAGGRADGPAVYQEACARCHGETGRPPSSMAAQLGVKDLTEATLTLDKVEHQIRHGSDNKVMPAFAGTLKDEQIAAVAAYVLSLRAP